MFNSSETRLAPSLLLNVSPQPIPAMVNQDAPAALIGTTRSRVNLSMTKIRKLGLIDYKGKFEVRKRPTELRSE